MVLLSDCLSLISSPPGAASCTGAKEFLSSVGVCFGVLGGALMSGGPGSCTSEGSCCCCCCFSDSSLWYCSSTLFISLSTCCQESRAEIVFHHLCTFFLESYRSDAHDVTGILSLGLGGCYQSNLSY